MPTPSLVSSSEWPDSVEAAIDLCISHSSSLTDWERKFTASIARRATRRLSVKQLNILERMVRKILSDQAAA